MAACRARLRKFAEFMRNALGIRAAFVSEAWQRAYVQQTFAATSRTHWRRLRAGTSLTRSRIRIPNGSRPRYAVFDNVTTIRRRPPPAAQVDAGYDAGAAWNWLCPAFPVGIRPRRTILSPGRTGSCTLLTRVANTTAREIYVATPPNVTKRTRFDRAQRKNAEPLLPTCAFRIAMIQVFPARAEDEVR